MFNILMKKALAIIAGMLGTLSLLNGALVQVQQVSSPAGHLNNTQVVEKGSGPYKGKHFPVGPSTCSRWIRAVMDRRCSSPLQGRFHSYGSRFSSDRSWYADRCRAQHGAVK